MPEPMNLQLINSYLELEHRLTQLTPAGNDDLVEDLMLRMHARWQTMTDQEKQFIKELPKEDPRTKMEQDGLMQVYACLTANHHRLVFTERSSGMPEEIAFREGLREAWGRLNHESQRYMRRMINSINDPQRKPFVNKALETISLIIHDAVAESIDAVGTRTRALIARRRGGQASIDERDLPEDLKIHGIELKMPGSPYSNSPCTPTDFVNHVVKLPFPTEDSERPYEYLWANCVRLLVRTDEDSDELEGDLTQSSHHSEDFTEGTTVSFKVSEIQDAYSMTRGTLYEVEQRFRNEGIGAIIALYSSWSDSNDPGFGRGTAADIWNIMTDRERAHIISFQRGMQGRAK